MSAKPTPGPWIAIAGMVEVENEDIPDVCSCYPENFGHTAAHLRQPTAERVYANARLCAAAPDLLKAAQCALGHLTGNMDGDWEAGDPAAMLRAAIDKATGS